MTRFPQFGAANGGRLEARIPTTIFLKGIVILFPGKLNVGCGTRLRNNELRIGLDKVDVCLSSLCANCVMPLPMNAPFVAIDALPCVQARRERHVDGCSDEQNEGNAAAMDRGFVQQQKRCLPGCQ